MDVSEDLPLEARADEQRCGILIVDDSTTIRLTVRQCLQTGPYRVFEAADGLAALELIKDEPDLSLIHI